MQYKGFMPNLKISSRATIQATIRSVVVVVVVVVCVRENPMTDLWSGCQDMEALGVILQYLLSTYQNRGFFYDRNGPMDPDLFFYHKKEEGLIPTRVRR